MRTAFPKNFSNADFDWMYCSTLLLIHKGTSKLLSSAEAVFTADNPLFEESLSC